MGNSQQKYNHSVTALGQTYSICLRRFLTPSYSSSWSRFSAPSSDDDLFFSRWRVGGGRRKSKGDRPLISPPFCINLTATTMLDSIFDHNYAALVSVCSYWCSTLSCIQNTNADDHEQSLDCLLYCSTARRHALVHESIIYNCIRSPNDIPHTHAQTIQSALASIQHMSHNRLINCCRFTTVQRTTIDDTTIP